MGVIVPNFASSTEDRASGALVVDGSLKFDGTSQYLTRSFGSGNRRTWTWASWVKRYKFGATNYGLFSYYPGSGNGSFIRFSDDDSGDTLRFYSDTGTRSIVSKEKFRDTGWYHIVISVDTTQGTDTDRVKRYVNGVQQTTNASNTWPSASEELLLNQSGDHFLGRVQASAYGPVAMSNVYFIDGQALDPSYFGYTDPLTNTWRPKKFKPQATPNNGTTWSSTGSDPNSLVTGGTSIANIFSGSVSVGTQILQSASNYVTLTTGPIQCNSTVSFLSGNGSSTATMRINGSDTYKFQASSTEVKWWDFSFSGTITKIEIGYLAGSGSSNTFYGIKVDGVPLVDANTTNIGKNGFYLPLDGNTPIGQDRSGNNNNWTPINFGGSNTLEKATGALPILNTDGGGKVARVGVRTDSYYANLKLAVPFVGVATDVVQQINGNSASMTSFTANNATFAVHPTAGAPYGTGLYLNSVSDYPNINFSAGTFNFLHNQTGSGTVEFWMYNGAYTDEAAPLGNLAGSPDIGFSISMASSTTLQAVISRGVTGSSRVSGTASIPQNTWSHIAATKTINGSNAELKLYVNGVLSASNTSITASDLSNSNSTYSYFRIGQNIGDETGRGWTNYYMNDLRIYDTVKYTQNFIPASTDPDILPDTPSGVAYSSNVTAITDGAVYFDGSGDYLISTESSDEYDFPNSDWTIEYFSYCTSEPTDAASFSNTKSFTSGYRSILVNQNSGELKLLVNTTGSGAWTTVGTTTNSLNIWRHIALVRNSGTITFYVDGNSIGSTTDTPYDTVNNDTVYFGRNGGDGSGYFSGFLSNVRIIKGTALYTSNFTPPTAPITAVANTKLLCCASQTLAGAAVTSPNMGGVNNGTVWSNYLSNVRTDNDFAVYGFDGSLTTKASTPTNGTTLTFTPPSAIPYSSTVEVYIYWGIANNVNVSLNGGSAVTDPGNQWTTIATGSGSITSMTFTGTTNAGQVSAIRVDGVILKDPVTVLGNTAATNFNPFTVNINAVRGQESGYATLDPNNKLSHVVLSNGNLYWSADNTGAGTALANVVLNSGKWYWEVTADTGNRFHAGVHVGAGDSLTTFDAGAILSNNWAFRNDGYKVHGDAESQIGPDISDIGKVIQIAYDADNGGLYFGAEGRWLEGNPSTLTSPSYTGVTSTRGISPMLNRRTNSNAAYINFGQKPFKFPPPNGFQPLNAANLRPSTIVARPDQYVGITTWSGDSAASRNIESGMKPDLVWVKDRFVAGRSNYLYDSVRGFGANKEIVSNATVQEGSVNHATNESGYVSGTTASGFTLDAGSIDSVYTNQSGQSYVAWTWKAGGNSNTFNVDGVGYATASAAGLTAGTITPTGASINTKSGFSIIKYTGTDTDGDSVPHGLSSTPSFILIKDLSETTNWRVWHSVLGYSGITNILKLNSTAESLADNDRITTVSSSTFTLTQSGGTGGGVNKGGNSYIAYCWADVPGLQKFDSYVGNFSADGPMIVTGFRPRWIMTKASTRLSSWYIHDTVRGTYNPIGPVLAANSNGTETSPTRLDILSNGFKIRDNDSEYNASGDTYIYAAFAEAPSFNLYGAQSNAR